jgi:hypothetical protein
VLAPLAVHFVRPLLSSRGSYTITVRFPRGRETASATLTYELEDEIPGRPASFRRIAGRWSEGSRSVTFTVPQALCSDPRLLVPRLVVANGGEQPVRYVVSAR